jgi:hypothetical protein
MSSVLGFVAVDKTGTVLHSSGLQSVQRIGRGHWQIFFDFSVANAVEVASLGQAIEDILIAAYGEPDIAPNEVTVRTYIHSSVPDGGYDATFQLIVVG